MEKRYRDGDGNFKPNTRTFTSVIDAWAKSGEKGAARRAEQILNNMITRFEATADSDVKPNVHTANAVCNVRNRSHAYLFLCVDVLSHPFPASHFL
jgi:hypothetical protein